jgi:hypothetical protein
LAWMKNTSGAGASSPLTRHIPRLVRAKSWTGSNTVFEIHEVNPTYTDEGEYTRAWTLPVDVVRGFNSRARILTLICIRRINLMNLEYSSRIKLREVGMDEEYVWRGCIIASTRAWTLPVDVVRGFNSRVDVEKGFWEEILWTAWSKVQSTHPKDSTPVNTHRVTNPLIRKPTLKLIPK